MLCPIRLRLHLFDSQLHVLCLIYLISAYALGTIFKYIYIYYYEHELWNIIILYALLYMRKELRTTSETESK